MNSALYNNNYQVPPQINEKYDLRANSGSPHSRMDMFSSRGFLSPKEIGRTLNETLIEERANQLKKENLRLLNDLYRCEGEKKRLDMENKNLQERILMLEVSFEKREQQKSSKTKKEKERNLALIETLEQDLIKKSQILENEEYTSNALKGKLKEMSEALRKKEREVELIRRVRDESLNNQAIVLSSQRNLFSTALKNEFLIIVDDCCNDFQRKIMKLEEELVRREIKMENLAQIVRRTKAELKNLQNEKKNRGREENRSVSNHDVLETSIIKEFKEYFGEGEQERKIIGFLKRKLRNLARSNPSSFDAKSPENKNFIILKDKIKLESKLSQLEDMIRRIVIEKNILKSTERAQAQQGMIDSVELLNEITRWNPLETYPNSRNKDRGSPNLNHSQKEEDFRKLLLEKEEDLKIIRKELDRQQEGYENEIKDLKERNHLMKEEFQQQAYVLELRVKEIMEEEEKKMFAVESKFMFEREEMKQVLEELEAKNNEFLTNQEEYEKQLEILRLQLREYTSVEQKEQDHINEVYEIQIENFRRKLEEDKSQFRTREMNLKREHEGSLRLLKENEEKLNAENLNLTRKILELESVLSKLNGEVVTISKNCDEKQNVIEGLRTQFKSFDAMRSQEHSRINKYEKELEQAKAELNDLRQNLEEKRNEFESMNEELENQRNENNNLLSEIENIKEKLTSLAYELNSESEQKRKLEFDIEKLRSFAENMQDSAGAYAQILTEKEEEMQALQTENAELKLRNNQLAIIKRFDPEVEFPDEEDKEELDFLKRELGTANASIKDAQRTIYYLADILYQYLKNSQFENRTFSEGELAVEEDVGGCIMKLKSSTEELLKEKQSLLEDISLSKTFLRNNSTSLSEIEALVEDVKSKTLIRMNIMAKKFQYLIDINRDREEQSDGLIAYSKILIASQEELKLQNKFLSENMYQPNLPQEVNKDEEEVDLIAYIRSLEEELEILRNELNEPKSAVMSEEKCSIEELFKQQQEIYEEKIEKLEDQINILSMEKAGIEQQLEHLSKLNEETLSDFELYRFEVEQRSSQEAEILNELNTRLENEGKVAKLFGARTEELRIFVEELGRELNDGKQAEINKKLSNENRTLKNQIEALRKTTTLLEKEKESLVSSSKKINEDREQTLLNKIGELTREYQLLADQLNQEQAFKRKAQEGVEDLEQKMQVIILDQERLEIAKEELKIKTERKKGKLMSLRQENENLKVETQLIIEEKVSKILEVQELLEGKESTLGDLVYELTISKENMKNLENELKSSERRIKELEEELKKREENFESDLNVVRSQGEREINLLKEHIENYKCEVSSTLADQELRFQDEINNQGKLLSESKLLLSNLQDSNDSLKLELQGLEEQLSYFKFSSDKLQSELEASEGLIMQLKSLNEEFATKLKDAGEHNTSLQNSIEMLKLKQESLREQLRVKEESTENLENALKLKELLITKLGHECEQQQSEIHQLGDYLREAQGEKDKIENQLNEFKEEQTRLLFLVSEKQDKEIFIKGETEKLEGDLKVEKAKYRDLTEKYTLNEVYCQNLNLELTKGKEEILNKQREISILESNVNSHKMQVSELENQIISLNEEINKNRERYELDIQNVISKNKEELLNALSTAEAHFLARLNEERNEIEKIERMNFSKELADVNQEYENKLKTLLEQLGEEKAQNYELLKESLQKEYLVNLEQMEKRVKADHEQEMVKLGLIHSEKERSLKEEAESHLRRAKKEIEEETLKKAKAELDEKIGKVNVENNERLESIRNEHQEAFENKLKEFERRIDYLTQEFKEKAFIKERDHEREKSEAISNLRASMETSHQDQIKRIFEQLNTEKKALADEINNDNKHILEIQLEKCRKEHESKLTKRLELCQQENERKITDLKHNYENSKEAAEKSHLDEVNQFQNSLESFRDSLKAEKVSTSELSEKVRILSKEIDQLKLNERVMELSMRDDKAQIEEFVERIQFLDKESLNLKNKNDLLVSKLSKKKEKLIKVRAEVPLGLEKKNSEFEIERQKLKMENFLLEQKLSEYRLNMDDLNKKYKELAEEMTAEIDRITASKEEQIQLAEKNLESKALEFDDKIKEIHKINQEQFKAFVEKEVGRLAKEREEMALEMQKVLDAKDGELSATVEKMAMKFGNQAALFEQENKRQETLLEEKVKNVEMVKLENQVLNAKIIGLEAELLMEKQKSESKSNEIISLSQKAQLQNKETADFNAKTIEQLEKSIRTYQDEIKSEKLKTETSIQKHDHDLNKLSLEKRELITELENLKGSLQYAENRLETIELLSTKQKEENAISIQKVSSLEQDLERVEKEKTLLETKFIESTDKISNLELSLKNFENNALANKELELVSENEQLKQDLHSQSQLVEKLNIEKEEQSSRINNLSKSNIDSEAKALFESENVMNEFFVKHQRQTAEMRDSYEKNQIKLKEEYDNTIEQLRQLLEEKERTISKQKTKIDEKEDQIEKMKEEDKHTYISLISQHNCKVQTLEETLNNMKSQGESKEEEVQNLKNFVGILKEDNQSKEKEIQELRSKLEARKEDLIFDGGPGDSYIKNIGPFLDEQSEIFGDLKHHEKLLHMRDSLGTPFNNEGRMAEITEMRRLKDENENFKSKIQTLEEEIDDMEEKQMEQQNHYKNEIKELEKRKADEATLVERHKHVKILLTKYLEAKGAALNPKKGQVEANIFLQNLMSILDFTEQEKESILNLSNNSSISGEKKKLGIFGIFK